MYKYIMNQFTTLYIYVIITILGVIYDAFLSKGVNYYIYHKKNTGITIIGVVSTIIWGLLIFLANYYNYNIVSWVLLAIILVSFVPIIVCDQIEIDLYMDEMYTVPECKDKNRCVDEDVRK